MEEKFKNVNNFKEIVTNELFHSNLSLAYQGFYCMLFIISGFTENQNHLL